MKYAVQYAYHDWDVKIPVDTEAISYTEAVELFNENIEDFKYRLREGQRPELVIWEDVGEGKFPNYHKELVHLDEDSKYRNGNWYSERIITSEIDIPK